MSDTRARTFGCECHSPARRRPPRQAPLPQSAVASVPVRRHGGPSSPPCRKCRTGRDWSDWRGSPASSVTPSPAFATGRASAGADRGAASPDNSEIHRSGCCGRTPYRAPVRALRHSSASMAYVSPSSHSPERCSDPRTSWDSRRMPTRSIRRQEDSLSAKHWAITRRR